MAAALEAERAQIDAVEQRLAAAEHDSPLVLDAFLLGTAFGEIGKTLHGGVALRLFF